MHRTLILDDDPVSCNAAREALSHYNDIEIAGIFQHSSQLFSFLSESQAELLFMDIELNQEMGFDVAKKLKIEYPSLMIVFLTGHSSYAIDGYDFQPVNFLTKPINKQKLDQTIDQIRQRTTQAVVQAPARIMFHLMQGYRVIDVREICMIEHESRKNYLVTEKERIRIGNYSMKELDEMLSPHGFFMCHQSYIISLYRVNTVDEVARQLYEVTLNGNDRKIPVSRNHYIQLVEQLRLINRISF